MLLGSPSWFVMPIDWNPRLSGVQSLFPTPPREWDNARPTESFLKILYKLHSTLILVENTGSAGIIVKNLHVM